MYNLIRFNLRPEICHAVLTRQRAFIIALQGKREMNVTSVGVERSDRAAIRGQMLRKSVITRGIIPIGRSELRQLGEIAEKRVRTETAREMRRAAAERKRNARRARARGFRALLRPRWLRVKCNRFRYICV